MSLSAKNETMSETFKDPYSSPFSLAAISLENFNSFIFDAVSLAIDLFSSSFFKRLSSKFLISVIFCLDRAGVAGADGPTHQGQYDISYMRSIPNFVLMAPKDESELQRMLITSINHNGPTALRIPRGSGLGVAVMDEGWEPLNIGEAEILEDGNDVLIIAYGSMVASAIETSRILKDKKINSCIVNARFVKPLDKNLIIPLASKIKKVVTMEEGTLIGGFGSAIVELLNDNEINVPVYRIGIPDVLVDHASPDQSKEKLGLMPDQMADKIIKKFKLDN